MPNNGLEQIAVELVERATRAGATAADVVVREADEFSTAIRCGAKTKLIEDDFKLMTQPQTRDSK